MGAAEQVDKALHHVATFARQAGMSRPDFLTLVERAWPRGVTAATSYNRTGDIHGEVPRAEPD